MEKETFNCGGLFSGIGGFCFGFEKNNFVTSWVNEISKPVVDVYKENFLSTHIFNCDIKNLGVVKNKLEPVDVLHAGFPCQSFSIAGNRKGFDDPRGRLFFEIIRLINEFGKDKPKVLVLKNSPNILNGEGGDWMDIIIFQLQKAGYWLKMDNCLVMDTSLHASLPQKRKRVFMIATNRDYFIDNPVKNDFRQTKANSLDKYINLENKKNVKYYLPVENKFGAMLFQNLKDKPKYSLAQLRKNYVRSIPYGSCPTLTANIGRGGHNVPFIIDNFGLRKLTEEECLKLQGFNSLLKVPDNISSSRIYEMIGNSVSPMISSIIAKKIYLLLKEECSIT